MKFFLPILLVLLIASSFFYTGCSPTSSDGGSAMLRGIVKDTTLPGQPVISGATVLLDQVNITTTTNNEGLFIFTNLAAGTYKVSVSKTGYYSYNTTVEIIADDTTKWMTVPLSSKKIYFFNDIILDIPNAGKFMNPAGVVPNSSTDKDVQTIDSIIGTDTYIFLRSADLMSPPGYQTWFSNRCYLDNKQSNFDTLTRYWTEDGQKIPETRDFPNHEGLEFNIDVNNFHNAVWYFYLRGRNAPGSKSVFGTMFLDSAWYDAGLNLRRIRVDIKINADGDYIFSLNSKK